MLLPWLPLWFKGQRLHESWKRVLQSVATQGVVPWPGAGGPPRGLALSLAEFGGDGVRPQVRHRKSGIGARGLGVPLCSLWSV